MVVRSDRQAAHRQAAVTVSVISLSDGQWESVILACDSLVRPSCQSEAFQHTTAGSSDKPVLLNNNTERRAENTPCCAKPADRWDHKGWGDKGPGGQTRAGRLLLIPFSLVPDRFLLQPQRTTGRLPLGLANFFVTALARPAGSTDAGDAGHCRGPPMPHRLVTRQNAGACRPEMIVAVVVVVVVICVRLCNTNYSYLAAGALPNRFETSLPLSCSEYSAMDLQFNKLARVPALSATNQYLKDWPQRPCWSNG